MGRISGIVTYRNDQPSALSQISAAVGGAAGGMTLRVRTDTQGRCVLRWDGNYGADVVYRDGKEVASDAPDGTEALHVVVGQGR